MTILNPANFLSILRIPLAFVLMIDNFYYRLLAIGLAMITDGLDGYLARRFRMTSQVGALLDPLTDKFFVFFAMGIFVHEGYLQPWQVGALLSRDIAVALFGCYLWLKGNLADFPFQSIWWGKLTTFLQFLVLLACTFHVHIPGYAFITFIILGCLVLFEFCLIERKFSKKRKGVVPNEKSN